MQKFSNALEYIKNNESKRVLSGQLTYSKADSFNHFLWVFSLSFITVGGWFLLLLLSKKKQFHPNVQAINSRTPINVDALNKALKHHNFDLNENEDPIILVMGKSTLSINGQYFLITTEAVYFNLLQTDGLTETNLVHGKRKLGSLEKIKVKRSNIKGKLTIALGDEIIGSLDGCEAPRVGELLKMLGADIRSA